MFLIGGTNHLSLLWLLVTTAYCIWFKLRFDMNHDQCLYKSQKFASEAYLWVCINSHEKLTKMTRFFVWYLLWKCGKYAMICIPHTASEATQKNMMGWVGLWGFLWWTPSAKRKDHHGVWMEQCLTSLKYWSILYTIWADPNYTWGLVILADSLLFSVNNI